MNKVEVYGAVITFRDDGILHIHYTSEFLDLEAAKKVIEITRTKSQWEISPVLISADPFSDHNEEAQKYLASDEVMKYCSAIAVVTSSLAQKISTNFFIRFRKPSKPIRFFNSEKDALNWLDKFKAI